MRKPVCNAVSLTLHRRKNLRLLCTINDALLNRQILLQGIGQKITLREIFAQRCQSHLSDLNRGPVLYESTALPTELRWQHMYYIEFAKNSKLSKLADISCPANPPHFWIVQFRVRIVRHIASNNRTRWQYTFKEVGV
jgi:hypothetical protein